MTDDRIFIFVNGIRTAPDDASAWTDRATAWFLNRDIPATDYEYESGTLTRRVRQQYRAAQLALKIGQLNHHRMVLVGHSNGTDLILRALALNTRPFIDHVFLIGAACDERFDKNGLNAALRTRRVGKIWCFCSPSDGALKLATCTGFLRPIGLGYGWLGLTGPQNVDPMLAKRVRTEWFPSYGHNDYFRDNLFAVTMRWIDDGTRLVGGVEK